MMLAAPPCFMFYQIDSFYLFRNGSRTRARSPDATDATLAFLFGMCIALARRGPAYTVISSARISIPLLSLHFGVFVFIRAWLGWIRPWRHLVIPAPTLHLTSTQYFGAQIFATYHLSPCQNSASLAAFATVKATISTPSSSPLSSASASMALASPSGSPPTSPILSSGNTSPRTSFYSSLSLVGAGSGRGRSMSLDMGLSAGLGSGNGNGKAGGERKGKVTISSVGGVPLLVTS